MVIQVAEAKVTPSAVRWTAVVARRASRATARPASSRPSSIQPLPPRMNSNASAASAPNQSHRRPERLEDLRNHPVSEPQTHLPARDVAITATTQGRVEKKTAGNTLSVTDPRQYAAWQGWGRSDKGWTVKRARAFVIVVGIAMTVSAVIGPVTASAAESLRCHGQAATILGTEGADVLSGTSGHDVVVLGDGADFFDGLGGDDVVCGEGGRDVLVGGPGSDLLDGGLGIDQLRGDVFAASGDASGDGGNDTLICGDGGDDRANGDNFALNGTASGDGGDDVLLGCDRSTGDNFALNGLASGDGGADTIIGAEGSVGDNNGITTAGVGGDDSITGTSRGDAPMIGDNTGDGGGGNDRISGRQGPDDMDGGPGTDDCDGGSGKDNAVNCEVLVAIP